MNQFALPRLGRKEIWRESGKTAPRLLNCLSENVLIRFHDFVSESTKKRGETFLRRPCVPGSILSFSKTILGKLEIPTYFLMNIRFVDDPDCSEINSYFWKYMCTCGYTNGQTSMCPFVHWHSRSLSSSPPCPTNIKSREFNQTQLIFLPPDRNLQQMMSLNITNEYVKLR